MVSTLRWILAWMTLNSIGMPVVIGEDLPRFQPVVRPTVPEVKGKGRTEIDRFILARLESKGLTLNPEADRPSLIRRVAFDLTGLAPTPADIDLFLKDNSATAYEAMVDRYLASPRYGERWGKYWLDAAGYADSNGYFNADSDRPLAWKYRDYVVKSLNSDKPYDRFVKEQLAGDELVGYRPGMDVTPAMVEALTATHFLRNAPDGTGESDGNPDEVRTDRFTVLEGNIQNLMNSLLGITIQCARCHDHKFEPITQAEYYSLQALLFPIYNPEKWVKPNERVVTIGTKAEIAAHQRKYQLIDRQVKASKDALAQVAEPLREQILDERLKDLPAKDRQDIIDAVKAAKKTPAQQALLKKYPQSEVTEQDLARRFPEFAALSEQVKKTIAEREKERPKALEQLAVVVETDTNPPAHHLLKRGQHHSPGEAVEPGVPVSLVTTTNRYAIPAKSDPQASTGRRLAFANWLTSRDHPLFAKVAVNRVWQYHFGTGIVATSDNLGHSGAKPSHPELLDWLTAEFVDQGWSLKKLHRAILTSTVYRQSSARPAKLLSIDPDNRLLASYPVRRLDAEAVRDAMLQVAGELDPKMGGPYIPSQRSAEGVVEIGEATAGSHRRSLYLQQRRTQVVTFLQLFDAPAITTICGKRTPSTVPLQSLAMLNSQFSRARAQAFAKRLGQEAGDDSAKKLALAYRLTTARDPAKDEIAACEAFLTKQRLAYAKESDPVAMAWTDLCQVLLASNVFLYVE